MIEKLVLSEDEWRLRLSPEAFRVLRKRGTEKVNSGCFLGTTAPGTYVCAGCENPLFASGEKFDSGTGWPAFTRPIGEDSVIALDLSAHGMRRAEVRCAKCDGHLGHVFSPPQRYCINSAAMKHLPL